MILDDQPGRRHRPHPPHPTPSRRCGDSGQTTAEYALVLLGAATVAVLLIAWAGGTGGIGRLLDAVIDSVIAKV